MVAVQLAFERTTTLSQVTGVVLAALMSESAVAEGLKKAGSPLWRIFTRWEVAPPVSSWTQPIRSDVR